MRGLVWGFSCVLPSCLLHFLGQICLGTVCGSVHYIYFFCVVDLLCCGSCVEVYSFFSSVTESSSWATQYECTFCEYVIIVCFWTSQIKRWSCGRCRNDGSEPMALICAMRWDHQLTHRQSRHCVFPSLSQWSWWLRQVHAVCLPTLTRTTSIPFLWTVTVRRICRLMIFVLISGTWKIMIRVSVSFSLWAVCM